MDDVIRRQSEKLGSIDNNVTKIDNGFNYRKWEWKFLRTECENLGIEVYYNRYVERLQKSSLSLFLLIHTVVCFGHITLLLITQEDPEFLALDFGSYILSVVIVISSQIVLFKVNTTIRYRWLPYLVSFFTIFILIATDILVTIYHASTNYVHPTLRPAYPSYVLFAIYIFLPLTHNYQAVLMAMGTSISYLIVISMVTLRKDDAQIKKIVSEIFFLLCVNLIGIYYRLMNEIAIRKTFLDRREYVEGNLTLKYAQNQEKDLLLSILPEHTSRQLEEDIRDVIKKIKQFEKNKNKPQSIFKTPSDHKLPTIKWNGGAINKYYVERFSDVSILYADIVNYTQITTQLPVDQLVEILHELFMKFDQASQECNVLRIKFLGDCYYGVAGVPKENEKHAKSCVELGIRMIKEMKEFRAQRNINIDMRIGVHSGAIIGGVIGACKWQYDIWSKDVDIASRMESTGVPGKVHISNKTLELLDEEYIYEDGTDKARQDPILQQNNIETFLISPNLQIDPVYMSAEETSTNRRVSVGLKIMMKKSQANRKSTQTAAESSTTARRNFMQNSMVQFNEIRKQTNAEMEEELERMPIGRVQFHKLCTPKTLKDKNRRMTELDIDYHTTSKISAVFLFFSNNYSLEWKYMRERDPLLKYSLSVSFVVLLAIIAIQVLNDASYWLFWLIGCISIAIMLVMLPMAWFKKVWMMSHPEPDEETIVEKEPTSKLFKILYKGSTRLSNSSTIRYMVFILIVVLLMSCSFVYWMNCTYELFLFQNTDFGFCDEPWATTQCVILTICICFLFTKVHFLLKFFMGMTILAFHSWIIFDARQFFFSEGNSTNPDLDPRYAHFFTTAGTMIIFHLIDRQTEYISRVDYNWKQQLLKKRKEAEFTKISNSILLENILPSHVAEIYMNHQMSKDGFYHEKYENVAIMFAAITNYNSLSDSLMVLNRIICDFDEILLTMTSSVKIEKIKVAGWTYMAACGLDPGRSTSAETIEMMRKKTSLLQNGRRSLNHGQPTVSNGISKNQANGTASSKMTNARFTTNIVCVMVEFALELMKTLQVTDRDFFKVDDPGRMRIGIAHGEVMAGVIGSNKPLYDVWGNTVNMASRMESTGLPGSIQVTAETAEILVSYGIACEYRGQTMVKGRGQIPTYFVCIDEHFNLIPAAESATVDHHCTKM